jgi:G3E family GTPase
MTPVDTHLMTGFPGAGKTTLLRALLAQRPPAERWALLLNASSTIEPAAGISMAQVTDGCACCSARVSFRVALVQLLRTAKPHRLLIELAGVGDPVGIFAVLSEASLTRAVLLRNTLCVVQPRHLANADITAHEIYLSQVRHADHIVVADTAADATAVPAALAGLGLGETRFTVMSDASLGLLAARAGSYSNDSSRRMSS